MLHTEILLAMCLRDVAHNLLQLIFVIDMRRIQNRQQYTFVRSLRMSNKMLIQFLVMGAKISLPF